MATARELLDQADALMRRNRLRPGEDIPVLTDAVNDNEVIALPGPRDTDLPLLTDIVNTVPPEISDEEFLEDLEMSFGTGDSITPTSAAVDSVTPEAYAQRAPVTAKTAVPQMPPVQASLPAADRQAPSAAAVAPS